MIKAIFFDIPFMIKIYKIKLKNVHIVNIGHTIMQSKKSFLKM